MFTEFRVLGVRGAGCWVIRVFRVLGVQGVQGAGCWVFRVLGFQDAGCRVLGAGC